MRPAGRAAADLRLARAAVFAAVCVLLSAAGHALAGGGFPRPVVLVAGGLAVLAWATPMSGRRRSVPGIPVALLAGQLGLHVLYCLTATASVAGSGGSGVVALADRLRCGATGDRLDPAGAAETLRQAGLTDSDVVRMLARAPSAGGMHHMAGMSSGTSLSPGALVQLLPSPWMLAAHAVAAALMGLLLWRGEIALWTLTARPAVVTVPRLLRARPGVLGLLATAAGRTDSARRWSRAVDFRGAAERRWAAPGVRRPVVRRGPPLAVTAV